MITWRGKVKQRFKNSYCVPGTEFSNVQLSIALYAHITNAGELEAGLQDYLWLCRKFGGSQSYMRTHLKS